MKNIFASLEKIATMLERMANTSLEDEYELTLQIRGDKSKDQIKAYIKNVELKDFAKYEDMDWLKEQLHYDKLPNHFEKHLKMKLNLLAEGSASYARGSYDFPEESSLEDVSITYGDTDITDVIDDSTKTDIEETLFSRYMDR